MSRKNQVNKRVKIGPEMQKILLLLGGGLALSLSRRPDQYFRVLKQVVRGWKSINERTLHSAIRKLYRARMIDCEEIEGGTVRLILSENGKRRILSYNLDKMRLKNPDRWDGHWRMVTFDIPERFKKGRDALSLKLKQLGFYPFQKSIFVYPHNCKDEVDFIVEFFDLKLFVRYLLVRRTDVDLKLKHYFKLR